MYEISSSPGAHFGFQIWPRGVGSGTSELEEEAAEEDEDAEEDAEEE